MTAPGIVADALARCAKPTELAGELTEAGLDPGDVRLATKDAARLLGVTDRQLRRYAKDGRLKGVPDTSGPVPVTTYSVLDLAGLSPSRASKGATDGRVEADRVVAALDRMAEELRQTRAENRRMADELHELKAQLGQLQDLTVRALPPPKQGWIARMLRFGASKRP